MSREGWSANIVFPISESPQNDTQRNQAAEPLEQRICTNYLTRHRGILTYKWVEQTTASHEAYLSSVSLWEEAGSHGSRGCQSWEQNTSTVRGSPLGKHHSPESQHQGGSARPTPREHRVCRKPLRSTGVVQPW